MEQKKTAGHPESLQAHRLSDGDLHHASGGVGYSSIQCKKCGKVFTDIAQYSKHIEEAHVGGTKTNIKIGHIPGK